MPGPNEIRSLIKFKSDVFPAPDAPIMKVVCPGRQNPVQSFNMCSYFYYYDPCFISSLVLFCVTVKLTLLKLILTISVELLLLLEDFCFSSLLFSSYRVPLLALYIADSMGVLAWS